MEVQTGPREKDLRHYLGVLYKRKWAIVLVFVLAVAAAWVWTKRQTPVYRAVASIVIDRNQAQVLSSVREVVQVGGGSYWAAQDYMATQFEVIKSLDVTRKVLDVLRDQGLLGRLQERMSGVTRDPETDLALMVLSKLDVDPLENSMMVYLRVDRVILYAHAELDHLVRRLAGGRDEAERAVYDFEKTYNVGTFENKKASIKTKLDELTRKVTELEIRRVELQARLKELKPYENVKDVVGFGVRDLLDDQILRELQQQVVDLRNQKLELSQVYGEKHPKLASLEPRLKLLEQTLRTQVKARVKSVQRELSQAESTLASLTASAEEVRQEEIRMNGVWLQYEPLLAKRTAANKFYDTVRNRQTETSLSAQVETNNVRVQDLALRPTAPVRPRPQINLLIGILLGLLGGIGVAFLLELLDNTVKNREDLEEDLGVTFLGVLPSIRSQEFKELSQGSSSKELITFLRPRSNVSELSRNIRTNLMFMRPEAPLHTILITSANPQEGKTTISVNIAISMAVSGKRTLLIDTDLRRPRVHTVFGFKRKKGVTEYLVRGGDLEHYALPTAVENLFVMPAGAVPPNPSELLHSQRFQEMLAELRRRFDFVIFDSPPITAVTDALIVGKMIDGIVLVARAKHTSRSALRFVLRELRNLNISVIGAILNDLDLRRRRYYYYRGRYYQYASEYYGHPEEPGAEGGGADKGEADGKAAGA